MRVQTKRSHTLDHTRNWPELFVESSPFNDLRFDYSTDLVPVRDGCNGPYGFREYRKQVKLTLEGLKGLCASKVLMHSFCLLLFAQPSLGSRISNGLFDNTFSGIYRLSPFDWSLLVPYFGILFILSIYGLHRYETMRRYKKYRRNLPRTAPRQFAQLPKVTVQLPLYNERFVVERLLEEVSKLDYPRDLLQIQVLDDSTDETHPYTQRLCNEYRAAGLPIEVAHPVTLLARAYRSERT